MIVSKAQVHPKPNKVVFVAPQASPAVSDPVVASAPRGCASQDQIRERAFQIFEKRGSKPGNDMQDWLRAERQILAR
ncbi:MAG: DUF2934 domain-containing protein [Terracidiphilus sp.]